MKKSTNRPSKWYAFTAILVVLSTCIFLACRDNDVSTKQEQESSNSYLKFDDVPLTHLNAAITSKEGDLNEEHQKINILRTQISEGNMGLMLSKIKKELQYENAPQVNNSDMLVLYAKNGSVENMQLDDIAGFSILTEQKHLLYTKNAKNKFSLNSSHDLNSDAFVTNDFIALSKGFMNNPPVSTIAFYYKPNHSTNSVENETGFSQSVINNTDFLLPKSLALSCDKDCRGGGGNCDPYGECQGLCVLPATTSLLQSKNMRVPAKFSSENAYEIRDNFMETSKVGRKYIDYYYKLSDVAWKFKLVNAQTALKHYAVAGEVLDAIETLRNGNSSEIVIDAESKSKFLDLIKLYKGATKNKEFQLILSDIEKDLNTFAMKKKSYVDVEMINFAIPKNQDLKTMRGLYLLSFFLYIFLNEVFAHIALIYQHEKIVVNTLLVGIACGQKGFDEERLTIGIVFIVAKFLFVIGLSITAKKHYQYLIDILGIYLITGFLHVILSLTITKFNWDSYFFSAFPILYFKEMTGYNSWLFFLIDGFFFVFLYQFLNKKNINHYLQYAKYVPVSFLLYFSICYLIIGFLVPFKA